MKNKEKIIRRLRYLLHNISITTYSDSNIINVINERSENIKSWKNTAYSRRPEFQNILETNKIIKEYNFTEDEVSKIYHEELKRIRKSVFNLKLQKKIIYRDNKGIKIGNGGDNVNPIRYPSKKRSLRTWKKFYDMFPYYAKKDGFNGKTSDKMK